MQIQSRIPKLNEVSFDGASMWFLQLQEQDLLFHPEDDPVDIVQISNGLPTFTSSEISELHFLMDELEDGIGHEQVIEAAYPAFISAFSLPVNAR
jgi:hypothetical protein